MNGPKISQTEDLAEQLNELNPTTVSSYVCVEYVSLGFLTNFVLKVGTAVELYI